MRVLSFLTAFSLGLLILSWSTLVSATDFDSAMNAYDRRDYYTAMRQFSDLAEQGDPYAQYMLGKMYAIGEGVSKDYLQAYKWLYLAESEGVESAAPLRKSIGKRMSPKKIKKAMKYATDWKRAHEGLVLPPVAGEDAEIKDIQIVKEVQKELKEHGYYFGKVDGVSGPGTRNAIKVYQHAKGVHEDGRITESLLELMGISSHIVTTPASQSHNEELAAFKHELSTIIARAKRRNSAEPWLISRLEKLVADGIDPWPNMIFHENFMDTAYRGGEAWRVIDGSFRLETGVGLIGIANSGWGSSERIDDLAISLLEVLISKKQPTTLTRRMAKIERIQNFSDSFSFTVRTGPLHTTEGLLLSCAANGSPSEGYQLAFHPGKGEYAKFFLVSGSNATEIPSKVSPISFDANTDHTFTWTRNDTGTMVLTVDGQQLLVANERSGSRMNFDSLAVTHFGDRINIQEIQLRDAPDNE